MSFFFGAAQYAIYINGVTELPFVGVIAGSVMTVVTPEFVRLYQQNQNAEIVRLWHSATRKVALLFLPLTAMLMVFAKDTIIVLFSDRYLDSVLLFQDLSVVTAFAYHNIWLAFDGRGQVILGSQGCFRNDCLEYTFIYYFD